MNLGIAGLGDATEIGLGGSATVYRSSRAVDGREVAVKVLNVADPVFTERFHREGQVLTTLSRSPRIVTVHEAGTTENGRPYLVLDLCASSLQDRLESEGTLAADEACAILADIAEALADAHLIGVVHRDLKPANILLSTEGEYLIADFGISTVLGSTTSESVTMTFTAGYVAPETLGGDPAGAPADVYALGATLFHLVSGTAPYAEDDATPNIFALANRVANEPLPDLRADGVPDHVCQVIEAAMVKDPERRPTAAELHLLLAAAAAGPPSDEGLHGPEPRPRPPTMPTVARLVAPPEIERYAALELLERHETSSVFVGTDTGTGPDDGRTVALRVQDSREFDPQRRKRFRSDKLALVEASAHPRLVELVDFGFTPDGRPYDVAAHHGGSAVALEQVRGDGPTGWPRIVEIGIMVGSAVEALHRAGFRHRAVGVGALVPVADGDVGLGDYGAVVRDRAQSIDGDLSGLGRVLLDLAGVDEPADTSADGWGAALLDNKVLVSGPRGLLTLLVELVADDVERPPSAYAVIIKLQQAQFDLGIAPTPLLIEPLSSTAAAEGSDPGAGAPGPVEPSGIDPTWAPPTGAGPNSTGAIEASAFEAAAPSAAEPGAAAGDDLTDVPPALAVETSVLSDEAAAYARSIAEQQDQVGPDDPASPLVGSSGPNGSSGGVAPGFARFEPVGPRGARDRLVTAGIRLRSLVGILAGIVAALVLLVGIYFVTVRGMSEDVAADAGPLTSTSSVAAAIVPVVADLEEDAATARLENAGFRVEVTREFDSGVPRGEVVSAFPDSGTTAEVGTRIALVVSLGSEPACVGSTEPGVRRQLESRDLTVAGVTRSFSETVAVDLVIRCVIYDDTETAIIVVSNGPRVVEDDG